MLEMSAESGSAARALLEEQQREKVSLFFFSPLVFFSFFRPPKPFFSF